MKKINYSLLHISAMALLLVITLKSYAGDYSISFTGTGASTTVESVIVQNLTQGTTVTVPAGNILTLTVSPNAINQLTEDNEGIRIYPNPMQGKSTVSFYAKQAGNTQLNVFGIDGRQMIGINKNLQEGENSFLISLPNGVYAIQVAGNKYSYAAKVISQTNIQNQPEISFTGNEKPISSTPHKIRSVVTTMPYTDGDLLLFKGISGNYSTIVTDAPTTSKTMNFDFVVCKDANDNNYTIVKIGTQTWMAENLNATKYRNGVDVPNVINNMIWDTLTTVAWCNYNNDTINGIKYGNLYNWFTIGDTRNIAPIGWHVPSDAEWTVLENYLITHGYNFDFSSYSNKIAKSLATTYDWFLDNGLGSIGNTLSVNNKSGFSGLPGGGRNLSSGEFKSISKVGIWWSSNLVDANNAIARGLYYNYNDLYKYNESKKNGLSIRCIKGNIPVINTTAASCITNSSAISGGQITDDGGSLITSRGVCWNTYGNPTLLENKTIDGASTGSFTSYLTSLSENQTYYVRAYATNSDGTSYSNQISFTTSVESPTVTDIDGNVYRTIIIGTQVWMAENLKTTKYKDGTSILIVTDNTEWTALLTPAYCWYNNTATNKNTYGALYNWYAVNTAKLAPTGWHVATDEEWTILKNYLITNGYNYDGATSDNKIAKSLAANTDWYSYIVIGTIGNDLSKNNSSGFTALPGGGRSDIGAFYDISSFGYWWISTELDAANAWGRLLYYGDVSLNEIGYPKSYGFSVRCVKD